MKARTTRITRTTASVLLALLTLAGASVASAATEIVSAAGDAAAVTAARDAFRVELGGGDTSSGGGLFGGLRREINWDGAPDTASDPNFMPADQFLARGVLFTTGGQGVRMSAKAVNPTNTPILFSGVNASHAQLFAAFTAERVFAPFGSNRIDVTFRVPGSQTPGATRGLGVVFGDVDLPFTTSIEYFTIDGSSLGKFFVPEGSGNQTFSFLGVAFDLPIVARAEIVLGNTAINGFGELPGQDVVITDDFIYGEPLVVPPVGCEANPTTLCLTNGRFEVTVEFETSQGQTGVGRVQREGLDSGAVWFFNANNLEMLIKVLNACTINDRFWVYLAAATDVGFTVTVVDTSANVTKTYTKDPGPPAPATTDSDAFDTCP